MSNQITIKHATLVTLIRQALEDAGVPASISDVEAHVMAEADLFGVPSHGVRMLPGLVRALRESRANPNPQLKVIRGWGATTLLDGDNGPGRWVSVQAMQNAIEHAKQFGVGVCVATRVTHWGRAHAYAYRAAQAGCAGICTTNAIPNMTAWGSTRPLLGNNPLAIGVPRGAKDPIVFDMAMSQAAVGKIGTYLREGRQVPPGWGLDADGNPTDDPAAILASRRLLPFGDHKGAGLALMMELLTGALAGGLFSYEVMQGDKTGVDPNTSKLFIALDMSVFVDPTRFAERVEDLIAHLHTAEPGLVITLPGDRGWQTRDRYLAEGIPLHADIVEQLTAIGVSLV